MKLTMHNTLIPLGIIRQSLEDRLCFLLIRKEDLSTPTHLSLRSDNHKSHLSIHRQERLVHRDPATEIHSARPNTQQKAKTKAQLTRGTCP